MDFLGWYHDVCRVFLYRYERTGLKIMVSPIGDQGFYGFAGAGELLHLVEHDQRVAANKPNARLRLKQHEERVEISEVLLEYREYPARCLAEIYQQIAGVLKLRELLGNPALVYAPCAVNQQRKAVSSF